MMSSSHAMEEEGRRFPGTVPIATILLVSSTRYKINGAPGNCAHRYHLSEIRALTIGRGCVVCLTSRG
jgi:hypothetical protein